MSFLSCNEDKLEANDKTLPAAPRTRGLMVMAATSLGHPEDIPLRSLAHLRDADLLVFEEDRPARSFLKAAGVHRAYIKYNEHHQQDTLEQIRLALKLNQTVVYMSDQGAPTLADPGAPPIKIAWDLGAEIRIIPGPSSVTAALSACPFSCDKFYFGGFLSRDSEVRHHELQAIKSLRVTWAVMDTPYRLVALLESCSAVFPRDQRALVALDISGPQEDYWLGTFDHLKKRAESLSEKLNFVLIGEGSLKTDDTGGATTPRLSRADSGRKRYR